MPTPKHTLENVPEAVIVAEIVKSGDKLILPEACSLTQAKSLIERRMQYEEESVVIDMSYDVFPWDGANAFAKVLTAKYGWAPAEATKGFFGDVPPALITIDTDHDTTTEVPWGCFSLPNVDGRIVTGTTKKDGRVCFRLTANIKRMYEGEVRSLFLELKRYLVEGSIYQGKAIRIRFRDDDGDTLDMPEPKFMRTDDIDESQLIFSREVHAAIETNLFTPITRVRELSANGIPVKRGILLGGAFGTGKTMAAKVASKRAVEAGVTFIYVARADELADAINFARQYQVPACVIFCEDIDRVMDGERDVEMDDILNVIDGIDTKSANIITVLTTNNMGGIHAAMLRPGRLDAVIDVKAPDAEAVQRLLRVYGGSAIEPDADLGRVGMLLDGCIPAVIAEVVKRAKLSQLRLNKQGETVRHITPAALEEAGETMQGQLELLAIQSRPALDRPDFEQSLQSVIDDSVTSAVHSALARLRQDIATIKQTVC